MSSEPVAVTLLNRVQARLRTVSFARSLHRWTLGGLIVACVAVLTVRLAGLLPPERQRPDCGGSCCRSTRQNERPVSDSGNTVIFGWRISAFGGTLGGRRGNSNCAFRSGPIQSRAPGWNSGVRALRASLAGLADSDTGPIRKSRSRYEGSEAKERD